jgi:tetratricopeptide (TPR) repeat protein
MRKNWKSLSLSAGMLTLAGVFPGLAIPGLAIPGLAVEHSIAQGAALEDAIAFAESPTRIAQANSTPDAPTATEENNPANPAVPSDATPVAEICVPQTEINQPELLREVGDSISAWIIQGQYLLNIKQYPHALTAYARAIALDQNNSEAWMGCSHALREMQQYDRAIAAVNQALKINPNSSMTLFTRGLIYKQAERYEEALGDFQKALEINQNWGQFDQANVAINLGSVLWSLDKRDEAIAAFEQATKLNDQFALAWFNLATAFLQKGSSLLQAENSEEAKTTLEKAVAAYDRALASQGEWGVNTGPASAWYNRGVALELLEKYEEAMESYDRALRITPNHTKARERLATLRDR